MTGPNVPPRAAGRDSRRLDPHGLELVTTGWQGLDQLGSGKGQDPSLDRGLQPQLRAPSLSDDFRRICAGAGYRARGSLIFAHFSGLHYRPIHRAVWPFLFEALRLAHPGGLHLDSTHASVVS
jgi:hypothetical protein